MSEFLNLCLKRQSCRGFSDKPVEREKLVSCVEAARLAPSACNSQPWSFYVVETPEAVAKIAKTGQGLIANPFLDQAKAFIIIKEEYALLNQKIGSIARSQYFAREDIGGAAVCVCLEAAAQGLGACQIGMFDRRVICETLGIDPEGQIASLIAIGYPESDVIKEKQRKTPEELFHFV